MDYKQPEEMMDKKFAFFHATSVSGTAMMIAAILSSYLSVYLTDTVGLAATSVSLLMFIAALWDAINDPLMGELLQTEPKRNGGAIVRTSCLHQFY